MLLHMQQSWEITNHKKKKKKKTRVSYLVLTTKYNKYERKFHSSPDSHPKNHFPPLGFPHLASHYDFSWQSLSLLKATEASKMTSFMPAYGLIIYVSSYYQFFFYTSMFYIVVSKKLNIRVNFKRKEYQCYFYVTCYHFLWKGEGLFWTSGGCQSLCPCFFWVSGYILILFP